MELMKSTKWKWNEWSYLSTVLNCFPKRTIKHGWYDSFTKMFVGIKTKKAKYGLLYHSLYDEFDNELEAQDELMNNITALAGVIEKEPRKHREADKDRENYNKVTMGRALLSEKWGRYRLAHGATYSILEDVFRVHLFTDEKIARLIVANFYDE